MHECHNRPFLSRIDRTTWLLIAVLAALGAYLLWDRGGAVTAGLVAALPWLVILACPLLHILLHRHASHRAPAQRDASAEGAGRGGDTGKPETAPEQAP